VILAVGVPPEDALGSLRLTLGRSTTEDDVMRASGANGALLAADRSWMTEPFSLPGPSILTMEKTTMTTTEPSERALPPIRPEPAPASRPDRLILVYDGDSGLGAMLLDVVKKAVGREECALCEITHGPLGKRGA
jgi:hypothetical protein